MTSQKGRQLHEQAEETREKGNFLDALKLSDDAMLQYQKDGDMLGLAEILSSQVLTLRHLAEDTKDNIFLIIAKHIAQASVEVAQTSQDKTAVAIPLYNLAKVLEQLGEFTDAVKNYKEALENMQQNPPISHDRPSVVADMKIHLATCEYKAGDKEALQRAEQALQDLEQSDEKKYEKDVWLSGARMRLAEILLRDNPQKAQEHLQKAREIINANSDLKIRKQQLEKLESSM